MDLVTDVRIVAVIDVFLCVQIQNKAEEQNKSCMEFFICTVRVISTY